MKLRILLIFHLTCISTGRRLPAVGTSSLSGKSKYRQNFVMVGQEPRRSASVDSLLQCLHLCAIDTGCRALDFDSPRCRLFEQGVCADLSLYQLQAAPGAIYFDVSSTSSWFRNETRSPAWNYPVCTEQGYCARECMASAVGDRCVGAAHCKRLEPAEAHHCDLTSQSCQLVGAFWEAAPGLSLPQWEELVTDGSVLGDGMYHFKGLSTYPKERCEVLLEAKIPVNADGFSFGALMEPTFSTPRYLFHIGTEYNTKLDFQYKSPQANRGVAQYHHPSITSHSSYVRYNISWCYGLMRVSGQGFNYESQTLDPGEPMRFIYLKTRHVPGYFRFRDGVADEWILRQETSADEAVYALGQDHLIWREVNATTNLSLTMDCRGASHCGIAFRPTYSVYDQVQIIFGDGQANRAAIVLRGDDQSRNNLRQIGRHEDLVDSDQFNTFRADYEDGVITAYALSVSANPLMTATMTHPFAEIRYVGVGGTGKHDVRLARYDRAWMYSRRYYERGYSSLRLSDIEPPPPPAPIGH